MYTNVGDQRSDQSTTTPDMSAAIIGGTNAVFAAITTNQSSSCSMRLTYGGNSGMFQGFLFQCFRVHANMNELLRLLILELFLRKFINWATALCHCEVDSMDCDQFINLFQRGFDHSSDSKELSKRLLALKQGHRRATEYTLFCTLVAGGMSSL